MHDPTKCPRPQAVTGLHGADPVYHPVWVGVDAELVPYADVHAGQGNFRAWSKITAHVVTGIGRLDRPGSDRDVLQGVFSRLGGRDRWAPSRPAPRTAATSTYYWTRATT